MPFTDFIKAGLLILGGQAAILCGLFFISGQLLGQMMATIYTDTTQLTRTVIASIIAFPLGNYLMAVAFKNFNPAMVSPLSLALIVLMNIVFAALIVNARPNWQIIPAVSMVMLGCVWVSYLLNQKAG